ncbi:MAG: hypothetical protein P8Z69_00405 [Acidihalobacter sp.]
MAGYFEVGSKKLEPTAASGPALWPSDEYDEQLSRLRSAVGQSVYLVEARFDAQHVSARMSGTPYELLAIIDFPRPDPAHHLYPHMLLLDDGRGVNLGRILRVSRDRPYAPSAETCLFENRALRSRILPSRRRLSVTLIRHIAKHQLGELIAAPQGALSFSEEPNDD